MVARTFTRSGLDGQRLGETSSHLVANGRDARLFADEHAVGVHELPPGLAHLCVRASQQVERRGALPLRGPGGEEAADVAEARRAENRVDERVSDHVAVRVPGQAPGESSSTPPRTSRLPSTSS